MSASDLTHLDTWDAESGSLNVITETPKGSRNKLAYDPELKLFKLRKVLPCGSSFPYDFGFIPSTRGEDGDPLDVLVVMDESLPPGCLVPCRLIGVIEAEQTEDGKTERNDRLIAVAESGRDDADLHSLKDMNDHRVKELEHFFVSYNAIDGKQFKPLGRHGPRRAEQRVKEGQERCRNEQTDRTVSASANGE